MKVSVVIPVYNEENRIEKTAEVLDGYLKSLQYDYEIVFCNDGSVDATFDKARELEKNNCKIKAVGYEANKGKGCAVRTGILASNGDIVLFTDCDLAYGTEVIEKAIDVFEKTNSDVVIGTRNIDPESYGGYSFFRRLMSKAYFKLVSSMLKFDHSDSQCGFKCFRKKAAHDIFSGCSINSFAFDLEALMLAKDKGYIINELPVRIINHNADETKVSPIKDSIRMLRDIRKIKKTRNSV